MKVSTDKFQYNHGRSAITTRNEAKHNPHTFQFKDNRPKTVQTRKLHEIANKNATKNPFQFVDNRPETKVQRKIQDKINTFSPVIPIQPKEQVVDHSSLSPQNTIQLNPKKSKHNRKNRRLAKHMGLHAPSFSSTSTARHVLAETLDDKTDSSQDDQSEEESLVTSIKIRQEGRGDHQYVIIMTDGNLNHKIEIGAGGYSIRSGAEIDDTHGTPISEYTPNEGLTVRQVKAVYERMKGDSSCQFDMEDYNCIRFAADFAGELGSVASGDSRTVDDDIILDLFG